MAFPTKGAMTAQEVMGSSYPGESPGTEDAKRTKLTEDLRKKLVGLEVKFPAPLEATGSPVPIDYYFTALIDDLCRDLLEAKGFQATISSEEPRVVAGNKFKWCSVVARMFIEVERINDLTTRISWGTRFGEYKVYAEAEKITVPGGTAIRLVNLEVDPVNR